VIAVVVASVVGIQLAGAAAGGGGGTVPGTGAVVSAATVSGNLKLKNTIAAYGQSGASGTGFVNVHAPITFNCSTRSTCTFTDEGTVQVFDTGYQWAICFLVDATYASCPYIGILPSDGSETTESVSATVSGLTAGSHTIVTQAFFYSSTSTIAGYDLKYRSYNP
jgi:hypothetical protein